MLGVENTHLAAPTGAPMAGSKTPGLAAKAHGHVRAPLGGLQTPNGSQSKPSGARSALGDISNRNRQLQLAPATALKSIAVADAASALDVPDIERMILTSPSPAPYFDSAGAQLEAEVDALVANGPCTLGASYAPETPDVLLQAPILPDAPPTPQHLMPKQRQQALDAAPPAADAAAAIAAAPPALTTIMSEGAQLGADAHSPLYDRSRPELPETPSAAVALEVELDFESLELVPPTPRAEEGEEDEDEDENECSEAAFSSSPEPNLALATHLASLAL